VPADVQEYLEITDETKLRRIVGDQVDKEMASTKKKLEIEM
jgi:hypothetical protein